ncbi:MAG: hypothetical protein HYZ75_07845 [Elusimicrobia bacterium]|nr:hypothetical protein [Elusimicrobiota bacterium]
MSLAALPGQERAVRFLRRLLVTRSLPPALLFTGPQGAGKADAAWAFAKALNCTAHKDDCCPLPAPGTASPCPSCSAAEKGLDPDLQRVDAEFQAAVLDEDAAKQKSLRIDTLRHVLRVFEMRSMEGRWKTAVLLDAHRLVPDAANAILKGLEEPPPRAVWILVTHRPAELLATVRSRCQSVRFAAVPLAAPTTSEADPADWVKDPMAPFTLAEGLPRELHLARPRAEALLDLAGAWLRRQRGREVYASGPARFVLRDLEALRAALRRNADPRLTVELAALRLQELDSVEKPR